MTYTISPDTPFRALVTRRTDDGTATRRIEERRIGELPEGEVTIRVRYSSLNYKDALSASGRPGVTRRYPHQPGIDAAGEVVASRDDLFRPGDSVIVGGRDLGMNTAGGFGEYIRVPAEWVTRCPEGLSLRDAMALGTAGFTAAMAVDEIARYRPPGEAEILVTGASGGLGSIAVSILASSGYQVCAVTGKADAAAYLTELGAHRIIDRESAVDTSDRPLSSAVWAGVIDSVGGPILASAIRATMPDGIVTACGNAASPDLPLTVFPFILRGIRLVGINSPACPRERRDALWNDLATRLRPPHLDRIARTISLEELDEAVDAILAGDVRGRLVVAHRVDQ
ncbi:MAG: YhdH/YhfP family quinone oxidoreductase [Alkalispirochaeta sp.]